MSLFGDTGYHMGGLEPNLNVLTLNSLVLVKVDRIIMLFQMVSVSQKVLFLMENQFVCGFYSEGSAVCF